MVRGRPRKTENLFKSPTAGKGTTDFDNPREVIDPNIKGKAITCSEFHFTDGNETNTYVLTSDASGKASWQAAGAGSNTKVAVDSGATADYLGAASNDGALRTDSPLSYTDGGDYVTIGVGTIDIGDDTNLTAGTNCTLTGDTISVDDAFLVNDANDTTTGTITMAGGIITGDASSADTAYVPMVLYNTDDTPPAASGFPIGTIYIQYTA